MNVQTSHHPELEELAAFIDGRLAGDRRQRMVGHLAACAECRDLFADAADLVAAQESIGAEPEQPVERRLLSGPWRRKAVFAAALAAALALVVVAPPIVTRLLAPANTLDAISEELIAKGTEPDARLATQVTETWLGHRWPRYRSVGEVASLEREELSFQLGVRVLELDIALRGGHSELAQRITYRLESLLVDDPGNEQALYRYASEQGIRGQLEAGADPRSLTQLNASAAALLGAEAPAAGEGATDRLWFELGLWARAAQLAAGAGETEFFAEPANRRRLRTFAEQPFDPRVEAVVERLAGLAEDPADHLPEIARTLDELITIAGGGQPPEQAAPPA